MINIEILRDFRSESMGFIKTMLDILNSCEGDFTQVKRLEEFGQVVDRIMGGAKSLALLEKNKNHLIHKIGDYAVICKTVGYKASQITDNPELYDVCVALLLDATEVLEQMTKDVSSPNQEDTSGYVSKTLLDRVRWVSAKLGNQYRPSIGTAAPETSQKLDQDEIDQLLKKLGVG